MDLFERDGVLHRLPGLVTEARDLVALNGPHEILAAQMGDDSGLDDYCAAMSGQPDTRTRGSRHR